MWGNDSSRFAIQCPMCLLPGAAQVGITKRGWPYCHCRACGSRCFANSEYALRVWQVSDPDVLRRLESAFTRGRTSPAAAAPALDHDAVASAGG